MALATDNSASVSRPIDFARLAETRGSQLGMRGLAVVGYLESIAVDGVARASYERLATRLGASRRTVIREMQRLEELGAVTPVRARATDESAWALSGAGVSLAPERGGGAAA